MISRNDPELQNIPNEHRLSSKSLPETDCNKNTLSLFYFKILKYFNENWSRRISVN
jgi:hypothetical protein